MNNIFKAYFVDTEKNKAIQVTVQHQLEHKKSLTLSNKTLHYLLQNYFNFKIM